MPFPLLIKKEKRKKRVLIEQVTRPKFRKRRGFV